MAEWFVRWTTEACDPGSIPCSDGTTDWLFSAGWSPNRVLLPAVSVLTG